MTSYHRIEIVRPGVPALVTAEVSGRTPGTGWVLLAPRAVGVCRSDLKELMGVRERRRDFGHELVADVVDCAGAGSLRAGDTVVLDPHVPVSRTSGFAELVELHGPAASLEQALPRLTPAVAGGHGMFVEPLACAARCVRRVREALSILGERRGPVAVVGAGIFGVLIASLLRCAGDEVFLLNRSRGRLDFLRQQRIVSPASLFTLTDAPRRRFTRIILATTFAEPELVSWCADHAADAALITVFGGTSNGMKIGDDGADLDALRRGEKLCEVPMGGRTFWLAGCHGAVREDFSRAICALENDVEVISTAAGLRGPELSLQEAVHALPRYARESIFGKPIVRL